MNELSVHPEVAAGDGIAYAGTKKDQETTDDTPHACYDGWLYLGYEVEDEHGEPVQVIDRTPCRRCLGS